MARRNGSRFEDSVAGGVLLDDPEFLRGIVERTVQEILETEMTAHVGVGRYERGEGRTGHRNGYKPRELRTRVGTLSLLVPQDREGTFSTQLFARYQRNEKALVLALMEMYVEGVSTRKVTEITEALCGTSFSKSLVSALCGRLDGELAAWRSRPLAAQSYPYLSVDALRAREGGRQGGEPGGVDRHWGAWGRRPQGDPGGRRGRYGEREHLPGVVSDAEESGAVGCGTGDVGRPQGAQGCDRPPLPGGFVAALPGALHPDAIWTGDICQA